MCIRDRKEDVDEKNNIGHLLTRLAPYEELDGIKIDFIEEYVKDTDIEIIQLSEYGEMERKFVTEFLSEICWQEVRQNKMCIRDREIDLSRFA